jgi:ribosomal protein L37AE/L43A
LGVLLSDITTLTQNALTLGSFAKSLAEKLADKTNKIDAATMTSMGRTLERLELSINNIEDELGLKNIAEQRSVKNEVRQILNKVDEFIKANPKYYVWHCSECKWEGELAIQAKEEDKIANPLNSWFVWRCPQCRAILADSRKHPFYWLDLPWSERAWDIACGINPLYGQLTVAGLAYLLEVSWEWIPTCVIKHLGRTMPDHLRLEVLKIEDNIIQNTSNDSLREALPDSGDLDP